MRKPLVYFTLFVAVITAACHKNKNTPQPVPTPPFDSTAYEDSLAHAQHIQDSILHYNDSVAHYQDSMHVVDSTMLYFFNGLRGTYTWNGAYYYIPLSTMYIRRYVTDTILAIDYADADSTHMSIRVGTDVFPSENLRAYYFPDKTIFESRRVINWFMDTTYTLTHYLLTDSIKYTHSHKAGAAGSEGIYLNTHK